MIRLRTPRRGAYAAGGVTVLETAYRGNSKTRRSGGPAIVGEAGTAAPNLDRLASSRFPQIAELRKPKILGHRNRAPECRRSGPTGGMAMPESTEAARHSEIIRYTEQYLHEQVMWLIEHCDCESPIERVMLVSIYSYLRFLSPFPVAYWTDGSDAMKAEQGKDHIMIYTQAPVGHYRVDILIYSTLSSADSACQLVPCRIAVECDGHDFHERTKEQAARDKARDRELMSHGLTVIHFTGSEIWNAPMKCAHEVVLHLLRLMTPTGSARHES